MPFSAYTGKTTLTINSAPSGATPSSALPFQPPAPNNNFTFSTAFVLGGNVTGGINEETIQITSIVASGSATINLQALTDILNVASIVLVRLKRYVFVLLNATQDSTNGTACSSITIGAAAATPNTLGMGGTAPTMTLLNGDIWAYSTQVAAGITVSASLNNVKILNNDGVNAAGVFNLFGGSTT